METKKLALPLVLLFVGSLLGLVFSGALIYEHNGAKTQLGSTVCNVNDTSGCDKAKDSAIGKIFGLPLALYGYLFYGGVLALAAFVAFTPHEKAVQLLWWGAAAALAFDIFLLLYSLFVLGALCRLCAITYVATVTLFIGAFMLRKRTETLIKPERTRLAATGGFTLILLAVFTSGIFFHTDAVSRKGPQVQGKTDQEKELREQLALEFYKQWKSKPLLRLDTPKSGNKGSQKPVVTIMEFADALCPHCKSMGIVLDAFVKEHKDKVKLIFRHYPLDNQCNVAMKGSFHVGSCGLAVAMECGEAQGKFWAMHDIIFANQEVFFRNPVTDKAVESMAQSAGLNAAQLTACFRSQHTMPKIKNDVQAGIKIPIEGTPTLVVNGRLLGGVPLQYMSDVLERILFEESNR